MKHRQPSLWETFFAEEVAGLCEPWNELVGGVYDAQGRRHSQSRRRGRHRTPAEVVLRMLILKHVRNWSYETLEREVRANVVYRNFCRNGMEKVPDAKTLVRLASSLRLLTRAAQQVTERRLGSECAGLVDRALTDTLR